MFWLVPNNFLIQDTECSCYLISNGLGTIIKFAIDCLEMLITTGCPLLTLRPRSRHDYIPSLKTTAERMKAELGKPTEASLPLEHNPPSHASRLSDCSRI